MFKVGDKVRIKSREQMEKEFGLDDDGDIEMEYTSFVNTMKHLCGRTADIEWIDGKDIGLANRSNNEETIGYDYSTDMIELVEEDKAEPKRTPTPGEYVEVSHDGINWSKRIYIGTNSNFNHYYINIDHETNYNIGFNFIIVFCEYIRPIQTKQTYTIEATEEQRKKIQKMIA